MDKNYGNKAVEYFDKLVKAPLLHKLRAHSMITSKEKELETDNIISELVLKGASEQVWNKLEVHPNVFLVVVSSTFKDEKNWKCCTVDIEKKVATDSVYAFKRPEEALLSGIVESLEGTPRITAATLLMIEGQKAEDHQRDFRKV